MALDPRFVIASGLQEGFIDKTTGFPLAGGIVTFWKDNDRTIPWPIYEISGTPPNYQYNVLPNPLTLSSIGTIQDGSGNDVVPYYKVIDDNGNAQLYFIQVESNDLLLQFTREGWPNTIAQGNQGKPGNFTNLVPNGQFLVHSNVTNSLDPIVNDIVPNVITQPITVLAQGGWTFERPGGSTATDTVTFTRFGSYLTNPTGSPRYAVTVTTSVPDSDDGYKDIRLYFDDVNKFSSTTQQYRLVFTAISNGSGKVPIDIVLIKNFGSGGSTTVEIPIATFSADTIFGIFQTTIIFGSNSSYTIGPNDDDFIQIAFRLPIDNLFSVSLTDILLMVDNGIVTTYPSTPDSDYVARGISGFLTIPAYDSSNLYLPLVLTPQGLGYSTATVGDVVTESNVLNYTSSISTVTNRLLANGEQYPVNGYSPLGIPYSRLFNYYFDNSINVPIYGTGINFVTAYPTDGLSANLRLVTNNGGSVTATSDGSNPTGFAFSTLIAGNTVSGSQFDCYSYTIASALYLWATAQGAVTAASAGTSGFSVIMIRNTPTTRSLVQIGITGLPAASSYFLFYSTIEDWYVWFTVNGVGTDPAPGGNGIQVNLLSTYDDDTIASLITDAVNGYHESQIIVTAGNTITAGSFFNFYTLTNNYYVWYTVDGAGTDPVPVGKLGIMVAVLSTDSAAQVLVKTQIVLNSQYFAVPDYRGLTLKSIDAGAGIDIGIGRWSKNLNFFGLDGDVVGTLQLDFIQEHLHSITDPGHIHAITDSGHTHTITDNGHIHTITDSGHTHGIADSGHSHGFLTGPFWAQFGVNNVAAGVDFALNTSTETASALIGIPDTQNATTGIGVTGANLHTTGITGANINTTGISINSDTTGITGTNYTGYPQNTVTNMYVNYAIIY